MIELKLSFNRQKFSLEIDEIFENGITGIYGPSGSGKTTLLKTIAGLVVAEKGKIAIGSKMLFDSSKDVNVVVERRNIGYVFQEGRLFPHMSIKKNLLYGIKKEEKTLITYSEVVELLELQEFEDEKPSKLSGGERQRVALGRALLSSPDALLLDEPFSALDVKLRQQIIPFLIRIQKIVDIPILVVSHDLNDLLRLSNKLCLIESGRILAHADYYDLLKDKKNSIALGASSILNSVQMKVLEHNKENGLSILTHNDGNVRVQVRCDSHIDNCPIGKEVKVFIHADDISLSKNHLDNVSIQNQLEGKIVDLIERESSFICIVDTGFKLAIEITKESTKKLELAEGEKIWCLFKSVAIDLIS